MKVAWKGKSSSPAMDMKTVLTTIAGKIANMTNEVVSDNTNSSLRGWISLIKSYEALMMHFLKPENKEEEKNYFFKKAVILKKLEGKKSDSNASVRESLFDAWLEIFSLLCQEMGQFGAFPMTFFEEVQEQEHPEMIFEDDMDPDELEKLKANL